MATRVPRYGERSLAELLPSTAAALGDGQWTNRLGLPDLTQAVVVLVDGLGFRQLVEHADLAPDLAEAAEAAAAIDAGFPTTTPVGLGTLAVAAAPGHHGMVGATFLLPETGEVLRPLQWQNSPNALVVQPEDTFFERTATHVVQHGPAAYADSGLTRAVLRGGERDLYERFDVHRVPPTAGRLDYVYLPQLDKTGHVHGVDSPEWRRGLQAIERTVLLLRQRLPADAAVIVTGDHGMVDVPAARRIDIDTDRLQAGVERVAGEPRMRHVYTADPDAVAQRWMHVLGERAEVLTRGAAIAAGLFGTVEPGIDERIGDVIAIAREDWSLASSAVDARVSSLRGQHGGNSESELLVPAAVLFGVA